MRALEASNIVCLIIASFSQVADILIVRNAGELGNMYRKKDYHKKICISVRRGLLRLDIKLCFWIKNNSRHTAVSKERYLYTANSK